MIAIALMLSRAAKLVSLGALPLVYFSGGRRRVRKGLALTIGIGISRWCLVASRIAALA